LLARGSELLREPALSAARRPVDLPLPAVDPGGNRRLLIMVAHSDIASRFSHSPLTDFFENVGTMRVRNIRGGYSNVAVWKRIK
jgi:hypothetical protein